MAESPFSWTRAEHVIAEVMQEHDDQMREDRESGQFRCGLTLPMKIGNALRAEGLLPPYEAPDQSHLQVKPAPATID